MKNYRLKTSFLVVSYTSTRTDGSFLSGVFIFDLNFKIKFHPTPLRSRYEKFENFSYQKMAIASTKDEITKTVENLSNSDEIVEYANVNTRVDDSTTGASTNSEINVDTQAPGCSKKYSDLDLSYLELDSIPNHYFSIQSSKSTSIQSIKSSASIEIFYAYHPAWVRSLSLHHNFIAQLSPNITSFSNLTALDISNNHLLDFPPNFGRLTELRVLVAKNNQLETFSFPKNFDELKKLEILNLSGNRLEELPGQILDLQNLKALYVGGNRLQMVPCRLGDMTSLEVLYLGGNQLRDIPATIGKLKNLVSLILCDNQLETIPSTVAHLQKLESLSLHNNALKTLPTEIVTLKNLNQLSLRSNPLVARFVRDMTFDPPSLKELSGRVVKLKQLPCKDPEELPIGLIDYLQSAHQCVNPKCKGVYFEARVEHVKFVDFCGKYRIPLLQYLCSPKCSRSPAYAYTDSSSSDVDGDSGSDDAELDSVPSSKLKKVLLG